MVNLEIDFLNVTVNNSISYLPFGVTTIEISQKGNVEKGHIRPKENSLSEDGNYYFGYADDTKDFLIIWGAGNKVGQKIDPDTEREFFQLVHVGKTAKDAQITFEHAENKSTAIVNLSSAIKDDDTVRMKLDGQRNGARTINFEGKMVPKYYSRWFPPNPKNKKNKIEYVDEPYPKISVEYDERNEDATAPIWIYSHQNGTRKKICTISGDLEYSKPFVELFFLMPGIYVIRFWLYWIHENIPRKPNFGRGFKLSSLAKIEIPDMERFDFVFDVSQEKIIWAGTDFHYQEHWGQIMDFPAEVKIADGFDVIIQCVRGIFNLLSKNDFNDPIVKLTEILEEHNKINSLIYEEIPDTPPDGIIGKGLDDARTHVPYVKNKKIAHQLTSSIVTKKIPE